MRFKVIKIKKTFFYLKQLLWLNQIKFKLALKSQLRIFYYFFSQITQFDPEVFDESEPEEEELDDFADEAGDEAGAAAEDAGAGVDGAALPAAD